MVQTETADYFAKALERCWHAGGARDRSGTGVWITIQDAIPIMLRIGWNTIAKEKGKAVYSAVHKRMRGARTRRGCSGRCRWRA